MELLSYLRLLRRRWMIVAASVLLALTTAAIATARMTPEYATSVTMVVPERDDAAGPYQAVLSSQERVKSYAELVTSRGVAQAVAANVGGGLTAEDLRSRITARAVPGTVLLRATVTDASPAMAMRIGHALGVEFPRVVDRIERPRTAAAPGMRVVVADDADLPSAPVSPRPPLNLALGLLAGLVAGVAAALLRDRADTSLRSVRSLARLTGGAALGVVGHDRHLGARVVATPGSARAEEFRLIAAGLRLCGDAPPRSVVVTGTEAEEGRSLVACNLAVALAETGRKVILVDAGLRGAGVAAQLDIGEEEGLTSVLAHDRPVAEVLRGWGPESLYVLPGGPPRPDVLLASPRMTSLLDELEELADIVVIDAPPVSACAGTAVLARRCTGTVIVARYGRTRREAVELTVERLELVRARVLGGVLGFVPVDGRDAQAMRRSAPAGRRGLAALR